MKGIEMETVVTQPVTQPVVLPLDLPVILPDTLIFEVTQEDIYKAYVCRQEISSIYHTNFCPVAQAVRRTYGTDDVNVGSDYVQIGLDVYQLSPGVADWIEAWDGEEDVKPVKVVAQRE